MKQTPYINKHANISVKPTQRNTLLICITFQYILFSNIAKRHQIPSISLVCSCVLLRKAGRVPSLNECHLYPVSIKKAKYLCIYNKSCIITLKLYVYCKYFKYK